MLLRRPTRLFIRSSPHTNTLSPLRLFPSVNTHMSTAVVHQAAQSGFGKGTNELYDRYLCSELAQSSHLDSTLPPRARPSYPDPALAYLKALVNNKDAVDIVE